MDRIRRDKTPAERDSKAAEERRQQEYAKQRELNASKESIRRLRGLISEKHRLDIYVWSHRDVHEADRDLITQECDKSDMIMREILFIVNAWEKDLFDPKEWRLAKNIKDSLVDSGQFAIWNDMPPWDPRRMEHRYDSEAN